MLQTRLWMGAVLIVLVTGMLFVDRWLAPWFPILFVLVAVLACAGTVELLLLLNAAVRPSSWMCLTGMASLMVANWLPHLPWWPAAWSAWSLIAVVFAGYVVLTFLVEMCTFQGPGQSVTRMALAVWVVGYLGVLSSFLAQLRWLGAEAQDATAALALTVFVPKCGDIGAYITGRLLGRHRMTPVLSPKKTWEGAAGGLTTAALVAILLDRFGPAPVLRENAALEIGFGVSVGIAGMVGDLAESLIKRDCQQKDASHSVPGFGGVLDVVDAILFAAPVSYVWLEVLN